MISWLTFLSYFEINEAFNLQAAVYLHLLSKFFLHFRFILNSNLNLSGSKFAVTFFRSQRNFRNRLQFESGLAEFFIKTIIISQ